MALRRDLHSSRFPTDGWRQELADNRYVTVGRDGVIRPVSGDILGPYLDPSGKEVSVLEPGKSRRPGFRQDLQPGVLCTGAAEIRVLTYQLHEWCDITDQQLEGAAADLTYIVARAANLANSLGGVAVTIARLEAKMVALEALARSLFAMK